MYYSIIYSFLRAATIAIRIIRAKRINAIEDHDVHQDEHNARGLVPNMRSHERRPRPHVSRHGRIRQIREWGWEGSECKDHDGLHPIVRIVQRRCLRDEGNRCIVRSAFEFHRRGQETTDRGSSPGDDAQVRMAGRRSINSDDRRGVHIARRGGIQG